MNSNTFALSSEECELLLAFELAPSIEKLAERVHRDASNISRALSRISGKLPVIEKQAGRWVLTDQGRRLNQHTRDAIQYQRSLLQKQSLLRIGTNREFAARIVGPHLQELQKKFPDSQIRISAYESGTEAFLLDGSIDLGIDCERPFSPEIAYKTAVKEPIIVVCNPKFQKTHLKTIKSGSFFGLPHLLCDRLPPDRILLKSENKLNILASFNDIATTRSACENSEAWALLPRYAVKKEIAAGTLVEIESVGGGESNYGVWWLRGRKYLEPIALSIRNWLLNVEL